MRQTRVWKTLGCAALVACAQLGAAGTALAQQPAAAPSDYPGGTIEHALEKIFDGEGGEGGLGMTRLTRSFSVPALRTDQVAKVARGNTVRANRQFAVYLAEDGTATGWVNKWKPVANTECATKRDGFRIDEDNGQCLERYEVAVNGKWRAQDDQLCMPGIFEKTVPLEKCYSMALVLNNVVFFDDQGRLISKGWNLAKGDVRAKII